MKDLGKIVKEMIEIKHIRSVIKDQLSDFPVFCVIVTGVCSFILMIVELNFDGTQTFFAVVKDLLIAVLASYFFALILNFQRPLIINDYLVVRKRESQTGNPLSISLLVGCPWKKIFGSVYDLKCTFVYTLDDGIYTNSAFYQNQNRAWIDHHFRFSFEIENFNNKFQQKFWDDFVNKTSESNNNKITVTITGASNRFGGCFRFRREYDADHILIGEDSFGSLEKNGRPYKKVPDIRKDELKEDLFVDTSRKKLYWVEFKHCRKLREEKIKTIQKLIRGIFKMVEG